MGTYLKDVNYWNADIPEKENEILVTSKIVSPKSNALFQNKLGICNN